ncbi:hypothetical protein ACH5RR_033468 [Cinchona calisaya]|uniref:Peptidase A1 domain-containing protein n=1 Tax=Cinchona calisaya TaxID=153742 RepID=A0ABD2YL05_9GENT
MGSLSFAFSLCVLFFLIIPSIAKTVKPNAFVLPLTKDSSTGQYITKISQRTPLVPIKLTVDLGGQFLWVDCQKGYVSSSYKPAHCRSAQWSLANSKACGDCFDGTSGELAQDVLSLQSTDGSNPGRDVSSSKVLFTCGSTFLLEGLASGVKGIAGLRRENPYNFLPGKDISKSLTYTPLLINPVSTAGSYFEGEPSVEYFIGVKSIEVNGKPVLINSTLLTIKEGNGGTKISTVNHYTVMETSIYKAFTRAFVKAFARVPRVKRVAPFEICFNSSYFPSTRVGPSSPIIDFVLQSHSVVWSIYGANSMVQVKEDVLCLGFVDVGVEPRTSIVIGVHQIEDNLLQFDLARSRLGFSSTLRFQQTTCSNFNFTSKA